LIVTTSFSDFSFTRRQRRVVCGLALLWFVGWLAATAPAQLVPDVLKALNPALQCDGAEGSLWRGSAAWCSLRVNDQVLALGRLDWRLHPWSLLWLQPSAHVSTQWGDQLVDGDVRISPFGTLTLRDARVQLPVSLLHVWAPVPARGTLGARVESLQWRGHLRELNGRLEWRDAQWQWGARWLRLGHYTVELRSESDQALTGQLSGEGDLAGAGKLAVNPDKRIWQVDVALSASRALPQEFRQSLIFLLGAKPVETNKAEAGAPEQLQLARQGSW
jgi:hypothetical protein